MARRPIACIQPGAREAYIIALTNSFGSPLLASLATSRARSCSVSVSKRTIALPSSMALLVKVTPAFLNAFSMVAS